MSEIKEKSPPVQAAISKSKSFKEMEERADAKLSFKPPNQWPMWDHYRWIQDLLKSQKALEILYECADYQRIGGKEQREFKPSRYDKRYNNCCTDSDGKKIEALLKYFDVARSVERLNFFESVKRFIHLKKHAGRHRYDCKCTIEEIYSEVPNCNSVTIFNRIPVQQIFEELTHPLLNSLSSDDGELHLRNYYSLYFGSQFHLFPIPSKEAELRIWYERKMPGLECKVEFAIVAGNISNIGALPSVLPFFRIYK